MRKKHTYTYRRKIHNFYYQKRGDKANKAYTDGTIVIIIKKKKKITEIEICGIGREMMPKKKKKKRVK